MRLKSPQPASDRVNGTECHEQCTDPHFVQLWVAQTCAHFDQAIDREMIALQAPRERCFVEFALRCLINPANAEAGRVLAQLVKERAQLSESIAPPIDQQIETLSEAIAELRERVNAEPDPHPLDLLRLACFQQTLVVLQRLEAEARP